MVGKTKTAAAAEIAAAGVVDVVSWQAVAEGVAGAIEECKNHPDVTKKLVTALEFVAGALVAISGYIAGYEGQDFGIPLPVDLIANDEGAGAVEVVAEAGGAVDAAVA